MVYDYSMEEREMNNQKLSKSETMLIEKAKRHDRGFVAVEVWSSWSNARKCYVEHGTRSYNAAEALVNRGVLERTNFPMRYKLVQ